MSDTRIGTVEILRLRNASSTVKALDEDEKGSHVFETPGGPQEHVGPVLASLYEAEPHPFHPYLPVPLRRGHW